MATLAPDGRRWVQDDSLWSFSHGAPITDWNTPQDQDRLELYDKKLGVDESLPG
jgi:hypothetical protein